MQVVTGRVITVFNNFKRTHRRRVGWGKIGVTVHLNEFIKDFVIFCIKTCIFRKRRDQLTRFTLWNLWISGKLRMVSFLFWFFNTSAHYFTRIILLLYTCRCLHNLYITPVFLNLYWLLYMQAQGGSPQYIGVECYNMC